MRLTIEEVDNGYILECLDIKKVFEDTGSAREALADVLREVVEQFGEVGSRYDEERISIELVAGDKSEVAKL
jgi:hypothetical protein